MSERPKARSVPFSRRQIMRTFGLAWLGGRTLLRACPLSVATLAAQGREAEVPQKILTPGRDKAEMAKLVQEEFLHAWNGYKQYAWGHDELKPLSKSFRDWHSVPLYMTPVDALDTMILMGLDDEAAKTREFINNN